MKTQIRHSVFETNSSSTHSLCIKELESDDLLDLSLSYFIDGDGNLLLNGGEFGWDQETFNDAQSKASYLAIYCEQWYPLAEINGILFKDILNEVILNQTKTNKIIYNFQEGESYIDHQSVECKQLHYLFEHQSKIRDFIFNKKSFLETDNDNH